MNGEDRIGLYVVRRPGGRMQVVAAPSADQAAGVAARQTIREMELTEIDEAEMVADWEIGRLGDYDPGIEGARMMVAAGGIIG